MIWDPYWGGVDVKQGLAVYTDFRSVLDMLYLVSGYLMIPIYKLVEIVNALFHQNLSLGTQTSVLMAKLTEIVSKTPGLKEKAAALDNPFFKQAMLGYVDYLVIVAMAFYRGLEPVLEWVVDYSKNIIWNVLIELSFTKRKESTYQDALGKRAADLTKLKVEYKNLSKEANMLAKSVITDELTNVYNKRFFLEKIAHEFKVAKEKKNVLAFCMIDIDHFKKLNDTYGHLVGDKVLKAVAHVAKSSTPNGAFCCRFGGEEFTIIMPGKNMDQALQIISKIHQNLPLLRFEDNAELRTSASFGLCMADFSTPEAQALENFEAFIKIADDLLYTAKLNGRNRIETKLVN